MWKPTDGAYVHRRRVRFGHTDAAGIAYTVRFFDFAMEAIESWFQDVGGVSWYDINTVHGYGTPFVHVDMDIKSPLKPGDDLACRVLVTHAGRSSIRFGVEGMTGERLVFLSEWVCVVTDNQTMTSMPIPEPLAARIAAYRDGTPGPLSP